MSSLLIGNVDLDLLEAQRQSLTRVIEDGACLDHSYPKDLAILKGLKRMLDDWSDEVYHAQNNPELQAKRSEAKPKTYWLTQQGGASFEWYLKGFDTRDAAQRYREDCGSNASYETTPITEVPEALADVPEFHGVVQDIIDALTDLEVVTSREEGGAE